MLSSGEQESFSLDALFVAAGGFGKCQWLVLGVALWAWVVHGAQVMSMVFVGPLVNAEFTDHPTLLQLAGSFFFAGATLFTRPPDPIRHMAQPVDRTGWFCGLSLWGWLAVRRGWLAALFWIEVQCSARTLMSTAAAT